MITIDSIRAAAKRLDGHVLRTPLRRSEWLSSIAGADVFLKLEVVQPTSSFKIRGAFNAALRVKESGRDVRLVTASAGNHGRALAAAARELGLSLTVFIAENAPWSKVDAIKAAGAELRPCRDYDTAEAEAKRYASSGGGFFLSPYSDPDVIDGAGTIALELLEDVRDLDVVLVPLGGGGLLSGIGIAMKALSPATQVVGVEVAASCPFTRSLAAGHRVTIDVQPSIADGLTGNFDPDTITLDIIRDVVDRIVVVEEPAVRDGVRDVVVHEHLIVEGAGAVGVAALTSGKVDVKGRRVAVVLTGANIDRETLLKP